jgi:hemerythrin-like domain-containing protein
MKEQIRKILLQHHNDLRKKMIELKDEIEREEPDFPGIFSRLGEFGDLLRKHLELEDKIFYPRLLEKMKEEGKDVKAAEDFISKMREIADEVESFLKTYNSPLVIEQFKHAFEGDLNNSIANLLIRISTEDKGVYQL